MKHEITLLFLMGIFVKFINGVSDYDEDICENYVVDGGWGFYPFPGSCNRYVHCTDEGEFFVETCAAGTFYDGHRCRHSDEVHCPSDPCLRHPAGYRYSDGQTCNGYYVCDDGQSKHATCPNHFCFKGDAQDCISDPSCFKSQDIRDPCTAGTMLPFPGRPNMFYLTDGKETMTPMSCPGGLWYNHRICTCTWKVPGYAFGQCLPLFHFQYDSDFLEKYNRVPQTPNEGVSIYQKAAHFTDGGIITIPMLNDLDMDSEFALCFEFRVTEYDGEIALVSNDYKKIRFTFKLTYIPMANAVKAYLVLKDGTSSTLTVDDVYPDAPHYVRLAKIGQKVKLKVDRLSADSTIIESGISSTQGPMVVGQANGCKGLVGLFDELKFFRCIPSGFFDDYKK